ncbi:MAG TPA: peptide-methionine (S)-S-oxide reductase MsrA [Ferruginibacter sp.]|nr:peptide-methionine (S)-S-oxide reductase MsrA [Ferruginibacter sp.]
MRSIITTFLAIVLFASCGQTQTLKIIPGNKHHTANESVAYFSEGCFWHAELVFQSLVGVSDAVSGFAGGTTVSPSYEDVCTGSTGHAETVQVFYDPTKISYQTLVEAFFASQDPTQVDGQGNDEGTQYRSIAFYTNEKEKQIINAEIKKLTDSKKYSAKIATQVMPFTRFYPAEDYHQEYIYYNPNNPYVANVSIPDFLEFKKRFKGNFKY